MLTEAEKKWLEERQDKEEYNFTYCQYCNKTPSIATGGLCAGTCPMYPAGFEYQDAAEFEARVAAKMTRITVGDLPCGVDPDNNDCQKPHFEKYSTKERAIGCDMCFLMVARLAVEEEM